MEPTVLKERLISRYEILNDGSLGRFSKALLSRACRRLSGACRKLYLKHRAGQALSEGELWLCDNAFLIEDVCQGARSCARKTPAGAVRYCYLVLQDCGDRRWDEKDLEALFSVLADRGAQDEVFEYLQNALVCALLLLLAEAACDPKRLICAPAFICNLRFFAEADVSRLIESFSPLSVILRADPTGAYPNMPAEDCAGLRKEIRRAAKKARLRPEDYAKDLIARAKESGAFLGTLIPKSKAAGRWYLAFLFTLYLGFSAAFAAAVFPLAGGGLEKALVLALIPCCTFEVAFKIADFAAAHLTRPKRLYRLNWDQVPETSKTLSVYTALLQSQSDLAVLKERVKEAFSASCLNGDREPELLFGLLLDLPEAKSESVPQDRELEDGLRRVIEELNALSDGRFFGFLRRRTLCGNAYCGHERKRGALLDLCRYLRGKSEAFTVFGDPDRLQNVRFLMTLDADTRLGLLQLQELIGILSHPAYRPVIDRTPDGRPYVRSGHAILQPLMAPALEAAYRTPFCVLQSGAGGISAYENAAFDRYQTLFSRGVYCGKGLFEIDAYLTVLSDAFPDQTVLSHDLLEGARLNCAAVTDQTLLDELPKTPLSYGARAHRWTRGDVQALLFAFWRSPDANGSWGRNPMPRFYRALSFDNLRRALLPAVQAFLLLLSPFLPRALAQIAIFASLIPYLTPLVLDTASFLIFGRADTLFRKFFSRATPGVWNRLFWFLYALCALFWDACRNLDAVVRALWRMLVSHQKRLEWNTASAADRMEAGILKTLAELWPSVIFGTFLLLVSDSGPVRLFGVLSMIFPIVAYALSRPFPKRGEGKTDQALLKDYARDASRYFLEQVTSFTHFLPPDHLTVHPARRLANRTSPTNIGLYLASLCAMRDFGFLDFQELCARLEDAFSSIERMKTHKGLLYNWYDLETLEPIGDYVSFVDCGNYLALLAAVIGALEEEEDLPRVRALKLRAKALLERVSLKPLYQPRRNLFCVGLHANTGRMDDSYYDFYMSEARMSSYFALTRSDAPKAHWAALKRPLITRGGYLGQASFSGTGFEYFMPLLLLPLPHGSFDEEALYFAAEAQKRAFSPTPLGPVFGISESAYYAFDPDGDYPYRAHGVRALSLRTDLPRERVVSPYTSFLMLPVIPRSATENLKRLKALGAYGTYGFYEAGQFSPKEQEIVQSYFAHHIGMSIVACANACFDGIFRRRFLRYGANAAGRTLLEEKIPTDASVLRASAGRGRGYPVLSAPVRPQSRTAFDPLDACAFVVPGKDAALFADGSGRIRVLCRRAKARVFAFCADGGPVLRAFADGVLYSSLAFENPAGAQVFWRRESTGVCCEIAHGTRRVFFRFALDAEVSSLCASVRVAGACRSLKCALSFHAQLTGDEEYAAHPAFSALRLEANRSGDGLSIVCRSREKGAFDPVPCALFLSERDGEICFGADLMRRGGEIALITQNHPRQSTTECGALATGRVCDIRTLSCHEQKTQYETRFDLGFSEEPKLALIGVRKLQERTPALQRREKKRAAELFAHAVSVAQAPSIDSVFCRRITFAVLSAGRARKVRACRPIARENLYRLGLSGDLAIVLCRVDEENLVPRLYRALCSLHRYHALCGFSYDLVFYCGQGGYFKRAQNAVSDAVRHSGSEYLYRVRGGVHLIEKTQEDDPILLENAACICVDREEIPAAAYPWEAIETDLCRPLEAAEPIPTEAVGEDGTYFLQEGFLLDKTVYDPAAAHTHVLASPSFGVLVTHRSLGFSFGFNSRLARLSAWNNDAYLRAFGERAILTDAAGKNYDLAAVSARVRFLPYAAIYSGKAGDCAFHLCVVSHPTLQFRAIRVYLKGSGNVRFSYRVEPVLGEDNGFCGAFCVEKIERGIRIRRAITQTIGAKSAYLTCSGEVDAHALPDAFGIETQIDPEQGRAFTVFFGLSGSEKHEAFARAYQDEKTFEELLAFTKRRVQSRLPKPKEIPEPTDKTELCISRFCRFWLPYQALTSRLFARLGFYQPGGAIGFRDQLQDALIYLAFAPEKCLSQILIHASHQFLEGDVQHWWHPVGRSDRKAALGVRTHVSDDYLWLIYDTCAYLAKTRDHHALFWEAPYLTDEVLPENRRDRYAFSPFTTEREPLYRHLCRAADLFLERGVCPSCGLAPILAGDWNDGMNDLPAGTGSVWLSQFGAIVLRRLSEVLLERELETKRAHRYLDFALRLEEAAQKQFSNGCFARAVLPDGKPLGADPFSEKPCSIDVLTQAFSAFSYLEKPGAERTQTEFKKVLCALESAFRVLFDRENGVFKLFSPPFSRTDPPIGYLCGYAPGVRENGGQYSHAAIWYAYACREIAPLTEDQKLWEERAKSVIRALIPASAACDPDKRARYELEPYVLCGDVWSAHAGAGRGGWNWYTGAAAWLWRYLFTSDNV